MRGKIKPEKVRFYEVQYQEDGTEKMEQRSKYDRKIFRGEACQSFE